MSSYSFCRSPEALVIWKKTNLLQILSIPGCLKPAVALFVFLQKHVGPALAQTILTERYKEVEAKNPRWCASQNRKKLNGLKYSFKENIHQCGKDLDCGMVYFVLTGSDLGVSYVSRYQPTLSGAFASSLKTIARVKIKD